MFINELTSSGAIPVLEATMRFAGQRQRLLAHNIANFDTPNFQPRDVSVADFRQTLRDAVDARRRESGGEHGELRWQETSELKRDAQGNLVIEPGTPSGNILFHDRNNRDLERTMQDLVENVSTFRVASDLLKNRYTQLQMAIAERI